jgi:hypothetical protein
LLYLLEVLLFELYHNHLIYKRISMMPIAKDTDTLILEVI